MCVVADSAVQTLSLESVAFDLGHVQPAAVNGREMELDLVQQPVSFRRR